jgi:hypothetical protein
LIRGEKNLHSIRTDFGFNLLRSASKLKRGVIEQIWWVLLIFRIREFSFPHIIIVGFLKLNRGKLHDNKQKI